MVIIDVPFLTEAAICGEIITIRVYDVDWFSVKTSIITWPGIGKCVRRFKTFKDALEAVKTQLEKRGHAVPEDMAFRFRVYTYESDIPKNLVGTMEGSVVQRGVITKYYFSPQLVDMRVKTMPVHEQCTTQTDGAWHGLFQLYPLISLKSACVMDSIESLREELAKKIALKLHCVCRNRKRKVNHELEEGEIREHGRKRKRVRIARALRRVHLQQNSA
tara:strand:+ start:4206 stop:4859 length:654 start_codon:yes stop_codon:yes gene_type:complete